MKRLTPMVSPSEGGASTTTAANGPQRRADPNDPTTIWLSERGTLEGAPPGAVPCPLQLARAWLFDGVPTWLSARRVDGVVVSVTADATADVRAAARELRERLCPRDAAALHQLALTWGHAPLAEALASLPPTQVPSFADLARALPREHPLSRRTARLLWALEHL